MKNIRKTLIIVILSIIILLLIGILITKTKYPKPIIKLKKSENYLYGNTIYTKDLVKSIINGKVINERIIIDKYPKQSIKIKYLDNKNKELSKIMEINVIDVDKPKVLSCQNITSTVGEEINLLEYISYGDNADRNPKVTIEGEYDIHKVGTYKINYIITDKSGNTTNQYSKINIVNNKPKSNTATTHKNFSFEDFKKEYKKNDTKIGIDVSKWQSDIDWPTLKNEGVEFAMIRIGYEKGIDGELIIDPYFKQNIENANKENIPVGLYFFSYAKSKKQAKEQAKWVKENIKEYNVELPIAFDWENWSFFNEFAINFLDINQIAETFIKEIEKSNYKGMLYSSKNLLENVWNDYENTWLAHYTKQTTYQGNYQMWQLSNIGKINGIKGDVDFDILYEKK